MLKHALQYCPVVPPLVSPYSALRGDIPFYLRDRLIFEAIEAHRHDLPLAVFMVRAWEQYRYPHIKMMRVLADAGITKEINGFWFWSVSPRSERSGASTARGETVDQDQLLSSSVVVAPRISAMGFTPPQKNDPETGLPLGDEE